MTSDTYLLTRHDIAAMPGLAKTHFRNAQAQRLNKSLGDATGLTGFGVHLIEVQPGAETTEHHLHYDEDECVYVLSGTATADIGEESYAIGPGDFLGYRRGGLAHSIRNTGDEVLRCLVVGNRSDHDICDYPRQNKRLFRHVGMPTTLVDMAALVPTGSGVGAKK